MDSQKSFCMTVTREAFKVIKLRCHLSGSNISYFPSVHFSDRDSWFMEQCVKWRQRNLMIFVLPDFSSYWCRPGGFPRALWIVLLGLMLTRPHWTWSYTSRQLLFLNGNYNLAKDAYACYAGLLRPRRYTHRSSGCSYTPSSCLILIPNSWRKDLSHSRVVSCYLVALRWVEFQRCLRVS